MLKRLKESTKKSNEKKKVKPSSTTSDKEEEDKKQKNKKKKKKKKDDKKNDGDNDEEDDGEKASKVDYAKSLLKRTLIALAPVLFPVFYSGVFIPLNNVMAGEPVSEAQILQTLMAMWISIIIIAFLTDPMLFFPSFKEFNIRWSFPLIIALTLMITGMLFRMYVSVGENECLLDLEWEYPEEDPLSDTGFEEVEDQVIGTGFHFYGLPRLPHLKKYSMDKDDVFDGMWSDDSPEKDMFKEHRILRVNITRKFTTSDEKERTYTFRAKLFVPCPIKLHTDALDSTIQEAFETQINDMEETFQNVPPKTDIWQTMSSNVFDRELMNFLSNIANEHLVFYFQNYGLTFFNLDMEFISTV